MAEAILVLDEMPSRVTAAGRPEALPPQGLVLRWGARQSCALGPDPVTVGAHAGNDVVFDDRFVSSFHCRIQPRDGRLFVCDLGSTNGTRVDGMRVSEAELSVGSVLRVGGQQLAVDRELLRKPVSLPGVISRDPALAPVLELLRRAAPSMLPVTILGESGTGKEVAARAVHDLSPRAQGPFVAVNCGAIAQELAEAELFGHEKGSFTGAVCSAPGAFGAADGGTLFLDEIGDLPLSLQVKLLRALESGEVKPVGAPRARTIDVRIVCATHHDLRARVRDGAFREDLYYRLRGVTLVLPPLRERPHDILPLAEHFLSSPSDGIQRGFAPDARTALLSHPWPGNARELRHTVHLAVLLSDSPLIRGSSIRFDGGPAWQPHCAEATADYPMEPLASLPVPEAAEVLDLRGRTLASLEEAAIRAAHERLGGNRRAMSEELGIARSSLIRKLDLLGLRGAER